MVGNTGDSGKKRLSYLDSHLYRMAPEIFELLGYSYDGPKMEFAYLNGFVENETLKKMVDPKDDFNGVHYVRESDAVLWLPHPEQLRGNNWFRKLEDGRYTGGKIMLLVSPEKVYKDLANQSADAVFDVFTKDAIGDVAAELKKMFTKE